MTKRVKLVRASEVEPRRVHSLFDKRLPLRAISTLAGPGGLGKSTLTIELGAKMTRGEMQGSKLAHSVMFVSTEDTASEVLIPRLMLADADMDRVFFPRLTQEGKPSALTLPDDMDVIERAVKKGKVRLVVLDPLFSMVSGSVNSNSDHHVRRMLAPLSELANRHALIIIAVVHTNKGVSLTLLDRVMGSVGVVNGPRSTLVFARDPNDEDEESPYRLLVHAKTNWTKKQPTLGVTIEEGVVLDRNERPIQTSRAVIGDAVDVDANDVLRTQTAEEHGALQDAIDFLRSELAEGPMPVAVLKEPKRLRQQQISRATLYRAKKALRLVSVELEGASYFDTAARKAWELPAEKIK